LTLDPQVEALTLQLANTAARNTAASIVDRITVSKRTKKEQETITELEEIVNGLLSDKSELVLIAQAYEQELIAQRISESDIKYISTKFVPLLRKLAESAAASEGQDVTEAQQIIDLIQPLLSVEMVTVLQLLGFNFRKAVGEPLTELVSRLILSKAQMDASQLLEIQRLSTLRDSTFLEIARDPEAYDRLVSMQGQRAAADSDA
jgi:hypothetical protein